MPASPSRTILCVEDEELQLHLRKVLFESAGYKVLLARSGEDALRVFENSGIDAVVMDYSMVGMDGVAVAEQMKNAKPAAVIIVLSGHNAATGEESSAIDKWFQKADVEPEELLQYLHEVLEARGRDASA